MLSLKTSTNHSLSNALSKEFYRRPLTLIKKDEYNAQKSENARIIIRYNLCLYSCFIITLYGFLFPSSIHSAILISLTHPLCHYSYKYWQLLTLNTKLYDYQIIASIIIPIFTGFTPLLIYGSFISHPESIIIVYYLKYKLYLIIISLLTIIALMVYSRRFQHCLFLSFTVFWLLKAKEYEFAHENESSLCIRNRLQKFLRLKDEETINFKSDHYAIKITVYPHHKISKKAASKKDTIEDKLTAALTKKQKNFIYLSFKCVNDVAKELNSSTKLINNYMLLKGGAVAWIVWPEHINRKEWPMKDLDVDIHLGRDLTTTEFHAICNALRKIPEQLSTFIPHQLTVDNKQYTLIQNEQDLKRHRIIYNTNYGVQQVHYFQQKHCIDVYNVINLEFANPLEKNEKCMFNLIRFKVGFKNEKGDKYYAELIDFAIPQRWDFKYARIAKSIENGTFHNKYSPIESTHYPRKPMVRTDLGRMHQVYRLNSPNKANKYGIRLKMSAHFKQEIDRNRREQEIKQSANRIIHDNNEQIEIVIQ